MPSSVLQRASYHSPHHILYKLLVWAAASTFEARCSILLENTKLPFIRGYENGKVDCGLLVSANIVLPSNTSEQLFYTLPQIAKQRVLLALDFKLLVNKLRPRPDGGLYFHSFYITPDEAACAAFIIQNPEFPEDYAIIPTAYIRKRRGRDVGDYTFYGREIPLTGRPLEPFPLEWLPFVMSANKLAASLDSLLNFTCSDGPHWENSQFALPFAVDPKPALQCASYLLSSSDRSDFDSIKKIWTAFRGHAKQFVVERLAIQPGHSDFFFTHVATGEQVAVEHKRRFLREPSSDTFVYNNEDGAGSPFYASASWDYLLINYRYTNLFCLISRSNFPDRFFDGSLADSPTLTWKPDDPDFLQRRRVLWTSDEAFVSGVEGILSLDKKSANLQSDKSTTATCLSTNDLDPDRNSSDKQRSEVNADPDLSTTPLRGSGHRWSRMLWEASYEELLLKQLELSGRGSLFRLGIHPCGTYVYAPDTAPGTTFHALSPMTPLVYINFASVITNDLWIPTDGRRPLPFLSATHGHHASIYLIANRMPGVEDVSRQMYVVPSPLLNTRERYDYHETILSTMVQGATRNPKHVKLTTDEHLGAHAVSFSETMRQVSVIIDSEDQRDLWVNKSAVVAEFLKMYHGETYWQKRNISDEVFETLTEGEVSQDAV